MAKTLMILGAGVFQIPLIIKAKEMKLKTIVCSYLKNDPGMSMADKALNISTLDKQVVLKAAKKEKIDGIITIASEGAMPTVAYVAEKLNLNCYTYQATKTILNKYLLRKYLQKYNIFTPKFGRAHTIKKALEVFESINNTCVMKPQEASGSRGLAIVNNQKDIINNFEKSKNHSFNKKGVIIEEFIKGKEVGGECLVFNGKLILFQITNKYLNKHYVPIGHSLPSKLKKKTQKKVKALITQCIKALDLSSGALNFDVMITKQGPKIIELGARLGGNCLPSLITQHTRVDTFKQTIKIALGEKPKIAIKKKRQAHCVKIIGAKKTGKLSSIVSKNLIQKKYPNIIDIYYDYPLNHNVYEFTQGAYRLGHVFFHEKNIKKAETFFYILDRVLNIKIK
jgi:biotin carboxylase